MAQQVTLTNEIIKDFKASFNKDPKNRLALNAATSSDPYKLSTSRICVESTQHTFQYTVDKAGKPITNQKSAGSCWIFSTLNFIRVPFMRALDLEEFEFSQPYLFFWHKVELCNFFLNNIVKTAKLKEPIDGRLVEHLLKDPIADGGQWNMAVGLIKKYGLMPKDCFPVSFGSESSSALNNVLKSLLRRNAKTLRDMVEQNSSDAVLKAEIEKQMSEIFRVIGISFSIPPEKFTWEYKVKSGTSSIGPITPLEFYTKHVAPTIKLDDKVCLVNDPRPQNPYDMAYVVEYLGNVVEEKPIVYNNQPVEYLMKIVATSLSQNEPVWFGCETGKQWSATDGIADMDIIDYESMYGIKTIWLKEKADRVIYCDSAMGHAMLFTGVSFDDKGEPTKYKIENSWGKDSAKDGYFLGSASWFKEFVFEIVIDKKFVSEEVLKVFEKTPKLLPAWDPMGKLA